MNKKWIVILAGLLILGAYFWWNRTTQAPKPGDFRQTTGQDELARNQDASADGDGDTQGEVAPDQSLASKVRAGVGAIAIAEKKQQFLEVRDIAISSGMTEEQFRGTLGRALHEGGYDPEKIEKYASDMPAAARGRFVELVTETLAENNQFGAGSDIGGGPPDVSMPRPQTHQEMSEQEIRDTEPEADPGPGVEAEDAPPAPEYFDDSEQSGAGED